VAGRLVAICAASLAALTLAAAARASNPQIAGLQVALRAYGLYSGRIDAIAGPQTVRATRAFQRRMGLTPDGRAGPATRRALGPLVEREGTDSSHSVAPSATVSDTGTWPGETRAGPARRR